MDLNIAAIVTTLLTTVLGAFAGAYLSSRFAYQQSVRQESDQRRRRAAEDVLPRLIELRRLLRNAEAERDPREWASAVAAVYDALDDARFLFPKGMKHLRRSVQFAVGEAVGGP